MITLNKMVVINNNPWGSEKSGSKVWETEKSTNAEDAEKSTNQETPLENENANQTLFSFQDLASDYYQVL